MAGSLPARTLARPSFEAAFEAPAFLRAMLAFESALAEAEGAEGVIPASSAAAIAAACNAVAIDAEDLVREAKRSATLAVPLVNALLAQVSHKSQPAAAHVHCGATSQDVIDTAAMLSLRAGVDVLLGDIDRAVAGFAGLALQHRSTAMVARTWLQHALPIPFGLKLAEYAAAWRSPSNSPGSSSSRCRTRPGTPTATA
jgi:3-carboxy-cis,cis-muconate cycloisomerase